MRSRGAGGDDTESNLDPLCRTDHGRWHAGRLHIEVADREARIP